MSTVRRFGADEPTAERALRGVLQALSTAELSQAPPLIAQAVYGAIYRALGHDDPYVRIKETTNRQALDLLPGLRRDVERSSDPLRKAVLLALAGNIIDFGTGHAFDLEQTIREVLEQGPAVDHLEQLRAELDRAHHVLYLADNAGEIVLDRLLLEQLVPGRQVTVAVRGGPIINDATLDDARAAGLDRLPLTLLAPEVTLPGVDLEAPGSAELRRLFDGAELIIAKGQGNHETLVGSRAAAGRPLFYLFMVKCELVARETGLPLGSPVVADARQLAKDDGERPSM